MEPHQVLGVLSLPETSFKQIYSSPLLVGIDRASREQTKTFVHEHAAACTYCQAIARQEREESEAFTELLMNALQNKTTP